MGSCSLSLALGDEDLQDTAFALEESQMRGGGWEGPIDYALYNIQLSSVRFSHSVVSNSLRPRRQASLSIINSRSLLKLTSIESEMPSNHFILCYPLLLLPLIFSSIGVFSNESVSNESVLCIRWPEYWSLSFSISPFSEYSGLISFRIDN